MGFKISGVVIFAKTKREIEKEPDTKGKSNVLERIESVGVWQGKELFNAEKCPDGILTDITNYFRKMKRPSPVTFTWKPPQGEKMFFHRMKAQNRNLSVSIGVTRNDGSAHWTLQFIDVDVFRVRDNRQIQRIEASFKDFNVHPEV